MVGINNKVVYGPVAIKVYEHVYSGCWEIQRLLASDEIANVENMAVNRTFNFNAETFMACWWCIGL